LQKAQLAMMRHFVCVTSFPAFQTHPGEPCFDVLYDF
jgi:hypothetical protein